MLETIRKIIDVLKNLIASIEAILAHFDGPALKAGPFAGLFSGLLSKLKDVAIEFFLTKILPGMIGPKLQSA